MTTTVAPRARARSGPFDPADDDAYQAWRAEKLAAYPRPSELVVPVRDPLTSLREAVTLGSA